MESIVRIEEHIYNEDNPHNLVKEDIPGLENIENHPIASIVEAEEGVRDDRYLTPLRLKSVFDGHLKRQGLMDYDGNPILPRDRQ